MKKNKLQKEIKTKLKTTFIKKNGLALPKTNTQKNNFLEALKENILPTPTIENQLSSDDKQKIIEAHFTEILKTLGLDLRDDSLQDSPKRIAKMYVQEIFNGLDWNNFPKITTIENKMNYNQMIAVQNVEVISCCEHHFQTIQGFATVAYIPQKKVIGLSKINRIVQFFSRRPQVQERLTKQIADCLQYILETPHVAVHINAKHFCVIARGIQDANSSTITTDLRGDFKNRLETRKEFLHSCK
ncbi:MAG: GTP cyclohydrolase I FolE [Bdellovibrionaceae bacterium]|nr:GTP cyclohydrolase I FolE [Pseudobdellovibrionaceae bacterium]NUM59785.1 GTP cyclohydrolase I FolE [Pseudobdellovibrionaceae bacterium]